MRRIAVATDNRADRGLTEVLRERIELDPDMVLTSTNDHTNTDLIVIPGDRIEMLTLAVDATLNSIPIAHIYGGESTFGNYDESCRHAITKLSHIHFVQNSGYASRVLQLGEDPNRVFIVGNPSLDTKPVPHGFGEIDFLVILHPETVSGQDNRALVHEVVQALWKFDDYKMVVISPNNDPGSLRIRDWLRDFARMGENVTYSEGISHGEFFDLLSKVSVIIGNSSSGILEAPYFGTPVVNIGKRQEGRHQFGTVINCIPRKHDIVEAIREALDPNQRVYVRPEKLNATDEILRVLKGIDLNNILYKRFYDLHYS